MRLLSFQASRFAWTPFSRTLPEAKETEEPGEVADAVVLFLHIEARDAEEERASSVFKKTLKHAKWVANKRELKNVVLHSFTHLGGESADPAFARDFMHRLDERLSATGYRVSQTPFGWFSAWDISVYGESMAKVYKEI
jgi:hypothetical protein